MVSSLSPQQFRQGDQPDLVGSYLGGQRMAQGNQLQQQAIQQNQQQISRADYDQATQRLGVIVRLAEKARSLPNEERYAFAQSINPDMLKSVGIDPAQVSSIQLDNNSLDSLIATGKSALPESSQYRKESVSTNQGLMVFDPSTGSYVPAKGQDGQALSAAQYDAALQGQITGAKRGAENAADIRDKPIIAGGVAGAQAAVEAATKPGITKATTAAGNEADAESKAKLTSQKNANALAVYKQGMGNLVKGLEGTSTGPLAGRLPALTENQQIADGAIAAMAPVLKSLFREAGEGTFTKDDQQTLMEMLPTRNDSPGARVAKVNNVNALIDLKLQNQPAQDGNGAPDKNVSAGAKKLTYDPATGTFK